MSAAVPPTVPLWTAAEAAAATAGRAAGAWPGVAGVSIDTRALAPGELFVALRGDSRDGHAFVADALARGAVAMVEAGRAREWPDGAALLEVGGGTLAGLEALGRAARARSAARIAAVTGSVGKTSTKEALRHALGRQGPTHASASSHNNHWGVPLSLARLPRGAAFGIFELGMNHAGEIRPLARAVRPHVAVITRIAPAHLENLGTLDAIADAKAEAFEGLEPGGVAVLPADDARLPRLRAAAEARDARVVTFGEGAGADWRLVAAGLGPERSRLEVRPPADATFAFELGAPGRHWANNAMAVLAAVDALGGSAAEAAASLADLVPPAGRGARRPLRLPGGGEAVLLDESYNANPASMRAAIELAGRHPGRRVAALGDMLELGPEAARLHAELAPALEGAGFARVHGCGPLMAHLHAALPPALRGRWAPSSADLAPEVAAELRPGDLLLVKGSLGSRMKAVVDAAVGPGGA